MQYPHICANFPGHPAAEKNIILLAFSPGIAGREMKFRNPTLAGTDPEVDRNRTEAGLEVRLPESGMDEKAVAIKIESID
jgi:hypothetical protein